jgi:hypothetical protein
MRLHDINRSITQMIPLEALQLIHHNRQMRYDAMRSKAIELSTTKNKTMRGLVGGMNDEERLRLLEELSNEFPL